MKGEPMRAKLPEIDFRDLRTPKEIGDANPAIRRSVRWWIERAEVNGFHTCILRVGRKLLIHEPRFNRWLADHLGRSA
jgi:hypothetical protein